VLDEVRKSTSALAEIVQTRITLRRTLGLGATADAREVCTAVSTTLFGAGGPDDQASAGLFAGNLRDYYDPDNSMIDRVLTRRCGIPISLSLIYKGTAEAVGASLDGSGGWNGRLCGINAPGHLLLAPADDCPKFVIDPFEGKLLQPAELEAFVRARMAPENSPENSPEKEVRRFVRELLARPMHRFDWTARALRNLRRIYSARRDYVRLLGASERLLLVSDANLRDAATSARAAVPSRERLECERDVAMCLYLLQDEERALEARGLLLSSLRGHSWDTDLTEEQREGWERLLKDDFFRR
jgi:regulator of sirC expression with transglutaminase-like and TPR domain